VLRIPSPRRKKKQSTEGSLGARSPRNKKDQGAERSTIARTISDQFRRPRREGFASLSEEKGGFSESLSSAFELDEENESSFDGPVQFVTHGSRSWEDNISQITMVIDDPRKSRAPSNGLWGSFRRSCRFPLWFHPPSKLRRFPRQCTIPRLDQHLDFAYDLNEEKESDQ
jgi:hypothetical protein